MEFLTREVEKRFNLEIQISKTFKGTLELQKQLVQGDMYDVLAATLKRFASKEFLLAIYMKHVFEEPRITAFNKQI
eukprot:3996592-Pyramimonas_sp.AAC.1